MKFEHASCNLCGKNQAEILIELGSINIVRCSNCGLIYEDPRLNEMAMRDNFVCDRVPSEHKEQARYSAKIKLFKKNLKRIERHCPKGKLLDVGCGYGTFLKIAQDRAWQVKGIELSKTSFKYATEKLNLDVINTPLGEAILPSNYFDVLTFWEVLDLVCNPLRDLLEARRVLKNGGCLALRIQNANFHIPLRRSKLISFLCAKFKMQPTVLHVYNFSPKTIQLLLEKAGFDDIKVFVSEFTSGDPYSGSGALGAIGMQTVKIIVYLLCQLIFLVTLGRVILSPTILVFARKPKNEDKNN